MAVRLCKLQCESTGEKIIGRCLPAWTTNRNRSAVKEHRVSLGTQRTYAPTTLVAATISPTAGRPAAASMPRPVHSFSPAPSSFSLSIDVRPRALRLFLGDVVVVCASAGTVPGRPWHAGGDRVRSYVLAGSLSVRQAIALSPVAARGRPAGQLSSIISRSRAERASFVCMQQGSRRPADKCTPADNPRASYYYGHRYIPP